MSQQKIRVSIVEDDQGTRENLMAILAEAASISCLAAYPSGEDAIASVPGNIPDVVLMDINLQGMNGIQCVSQLKARLPKLQILMLTTYEDSKLIFDSLRAGASGYLLKNVEPGEVVQAVEQVHAGGSPMSMHIARKVVNHFQQVKKASEVDTLSKREHEILALLAKGYLYKEIAAELGITTGPLGSICIPFTKSSTLQSRTEAVVKFLGR